MKTPPKNREEARAQSRRRLSYVLAGAGAALVLAVVLVLVLLTGGRATAKGVLTEYFETMYVYNGKGFDEMTACFAPDLQSQWYNSMTLNGMNFTQLAQWRLEAIEQVGDNVRLRVKVTETAGGSGADLVTIRESYAAAEAVCDVIFELHIEGDTGSMVCHGVTELVKLDGQWCFVSTSIPVTVQSRSGSAQDWFDKYGQTETEEAE